MREQPVGERAGRFQPARRRERLLDLAEDLRLADDQRVEARGHAEQVVAPPRVPGR